MRGFVSAHFLQFYCEMKKSIIISIILLALIVNGCANRRHSASSVFPFPEFVSSLPELCTNTIFPLQQRTGYTDSMLIAKYLNVDTASFRQLESVRRIFHMPTLVGRDRGSREESQRLIQQQRLRYPRRQIRNIDEVSRWLTEVYTNNEYVRHFYSRPGVRRCSHRRFDFTHYKQVEDGFLVKGQLASVSSGVLPYCSRWRRYGIFLVGRDHNIIEIKRWEVDPCPPCPNDPRAYAEINIQIHFPEFENADVRLPELRNHSFDSLLLRNIRYPPIALEVAIHGRVIVSFMVEAEGEISNLEIMVREIDPVFNREVLRTVQGVADRQWIPGMKNGEKTPMEILVEVEFGAIQWPNTRGERRRSVPPPRQEDIRKSIVSNQISAQPTITK